MQRLVMRSAVMMGGGGAHGLRAQAQRSLKLFKDLIVKYWHNGIQFLTLQYSVNENRSYFKSSILKPVTVYI